MVVKVLFRTFLTESKRQKFGLVFNFVRINFKLLKVKMPNYGKRGRGKKLVDGMVVAIEPMINMGTRRIKQLKDGWTILTADGQPSAHFEHNVAMVNGKPELLSTFQYIYDALGIKSEEEDEFRQKTE